MLRANCLTTAAVAAAQMVILAGHALAQAGKCDPNDASARCVMLRDVERDLPKLKAQAEESKSLTLPSPSRPSTGYSYSPGDHGGARALGNLKEEESLRLNRQILEQLK